MTPTNARKRNLTYASPMFLDVIVNTIVKNIKENKVLSNNIITIYKISFGNIPIMVKSNSCILKTDETNINQNDECKYDGGGYFIINGSEKVIVSQERTCANKVFCLKKNMLNTRIL